MKTQKSLLALGALGVVYGDIGTSPLYALRESLLYMPTTPDNILGVLSLICWSLLIIVTIKYLTIVFKADNEGEGGILALLSLIKRHSPKSLKFIVLVALIGAGLLIGDGMLTPAISVTSAIEGLRVISPSSSPHLVSLSCMVLFVLFVFQRHGTRVIGLIFGPVILIWFLVIAFLGTLQIITYPNILSAINPLYAVHYLKNNGWPGYHSLGGVFLVVTGAEALFADIGHFGKRPIRFTWYLIVFPCLILNYLGQGVVVLHHPEALSNPFYHLVSKEWLMPLIILATFSTIIASQAIITATFSLIKQAISLGIFPRMRMIQTSKYMVGQIYIPQMNLILMLGALLLVVWFRNADGLAHAYGIGVNLEMMLVTLLVAYAAYCVWKWSMLRVVLIFGGLLAIDGMFLGSNLNKFMTGGWIPICLAWIVAITMMTWKGGFAYLQQTVYRDHPYIEQLSAKIIGGEGAALAGVTAIFVTDQYDHTGRSFLHFLRVSLAFAERILIVSCRVEHRPYVHFSRRFSLQKIDSNIYGLALHYGFMEQVSIPQALMLASHKGILPFSIDLDQVTYWVEVLYAVASKEKMTLAFHTQERLFSFLMRNYSLNMNIEFYRLPYDKTVALGTYTVI